MKYHHQFVSPNTVRIELIPEDQKEKQLLETLKSPIESPEKLTKLYQLGIDGYANGATLTTTNFMQHPHVVLCRFAKIQSSDRVA